MEWPVLRSALFMAIIHQTHENWFKSFTSFSMEVGLGLTTAICNFACTSLGQKAPQTRAWLTQSVSFPCWGGSWSFRTDRAMYSSVSCNRTLIYMFIYLFLNKRTFLWPVTLFAVNIIPLSCVLLIPPSAQPHFDAFSSVTKSHLSATQSHITKRPKVCPVTKK